MLRAANGSDSLLGVIVDIAPSARATFDPAGQEFSSGYPPLGAQQAVAAPADLAAVLGAAGVNTGQVKYACTALVIEGAYGGSGAESALSAWTDALTLTADKATVTFTQTAGSVTRIYRKHSTDAGTTWSDPYRLFTDWASAGTLTDDLAFDSPYIDYSKIPPAANQIGEHYGVGFVPALSVELTADQKPVENQEMGAGEGVPAALNGEVEITGKIDEALRTGIGMVVFASGAGKPVATPVSGEPTTVYALDSASGRDSRLSFSVLDWPGATLPGQGYIGLRASQFDVDIQDGKVISASAQLLGKHYMINAPLAPTVGTTYEACGLALGGRWDANETTGTMSVKVTTAPAAGAFAVKAKSKAAATYDGSAIAGRYDTTDKKQTRGASNTQDYIALTDETGASMGQDDANGFFPLGLIFPGDMSVLGLNDEFAGAPTIAIPTRTKLHMLAESQLTKGHATLTKGGAALRCYTCKMGFKFSMVNAPEIGPWAMYPADVDGPLENDVELDIVAAYRDRSWERLLRRGEVFSVGLSIAGPPIIVNPGVLAANGARESAVFTFPAAQVMSVSRPRSGRGETRQTVKLKVRQPSNGSPYFSATWTSGTRFAGTTAP